MSLPSPPSNTSLPLPPLSTSLPSPPISVSLPLPPVSVLFPSPPSMMSLPFPPFSVSLPAVPADMLTPVTLAKFTGVEPMMLLPPVNTRWASNWPHRSLPPGPKGVVAAFPRTMELVSVVTPPKSAIPPPNLALLSVTVEFVSVITL